MASYQYVLAVVIGVLIVILLRWKDIVEILRLHREIKQLEKKIHPTA